MSQKYSVNVKSWENFFNGETDDLFEDFGAVVIDLGIVEFVLVLEGGAETFKMFELLVVQEGLLSVELEKLFLWSIDFDGFVKETNTHGVVFLLFLLGSRGFVEVSCGERLRMLINE